MGVTNKKEMYNLFQAHIQFKDGTTEMREQREINSLKEMREFIWDIHTGHKLPEGTAWLICTPESKHFVFMEAKCKENQ